ncbi:hypothetical protein [Paractinoplanes maris]|uniref:hypothetical protein n=1 Tax=Paractinoplanes maris TaxID=1734446 RepID=UPI002021B4DF|nr:hypothetical protein [Actinoplanes maris]
MPGYRFVVTDLSTGQPVVKDEWTVEHPDDAAAWAECADVVLSGRQQVLVYRDGVERPFGSKVSDALADVMDSDAWK